MQQKILKLPEVMKTCALSRSSIYAFIRSGSFPAPIPLGLKAVGWLESEVLQWIEQRLRMRIVKKPSVE